jgi:hypothetical protein
MKSFGEHPGQEGEQGHADEIEIEKHRAHSLKATPGQWSQSSLAVSNLLPVRVTRFIHSQLKGPT